MDAVSMSVFRDWLDRVEGLEELHLHSLSLTTPQSPLTIHVTPPPASPPPRSEWSLPGYTIGKTLGAGSYGTVREALHAETGYTVRAHGGTHDPTR
jgi:serine/threonine protein kinase